METETQSLASELAQFAGTENYYRHWLGINYTDGVKHMAEKAKAYWLIDLVASWQREVLKKLAGYNERNFQVWRLEARQKGGAVARCTNGNDGYLAGQHIEYTTFPAELIPFEMFLVDGVLMLKSEY
jgi:hypothetical protein